MDVKLLLALIVFWGFMSGVYVFGNVAGYTTNANINSIGNNATIAINETGTGQEGFFSNVNTPFMTIIKFLGFVLFGIGLPSDTPPVFAWGFGFIITCVNLLCIVLLVNSFWSGGK